VKLSNIVDSMFLGGVLVFAILCAVGFIGLVSTYFVFFISFCLIYQLLFIPIVDKIAVQQQEQPPNKDKDVDRRK
jgi:hypothetical protein